MLAERNKGILTYQGTRYRGFQRQRYQALFSGDLEVPAQWLLEMQLCIFTYNKNYFLYKCLYN